jgi:hypothetical protein
VTLPTPDKVDFRKKEHCRGKKGYFLVIKRSMSQKDITFLNMDARDDV